MEEGDSISIDLTARANPSEIEYKWTNPDRGIIPSAADSVSADSRILSDGGVLNLTSARRSDAGRYKVKASNSEGKATVKFRIDVLYGPR